MEVEVEVEVMMVVREEKEEVVMVVVGTVEEVTEVEERGERVGTTEVDTFLCHTPHRYYSRNP